ncbi:MAG: hypothetical protein A3H27_13595 [Acidobacteria bacterium RIFCSPLOWO2_02_FULL_59_13]|nr:MAG: hypothetical protein A3H27_13595 [Acidobacteria bacterium RIFCSPLOWO2_02_FULL_59_13]
MKRLAPRAAVCGWLLACFFAAESAFPQSPPAELRLKVDVRLVRVVATVRDAKGRLVPHLGPEDFEIYEEGRPQRIALFEAETDLPLSIALLLDSSPSAAKEWNFVATSAGAFLRRVLRPSDQAAVYEFAGNVRRLANYTSQWPRLEGAIRGIQLSSGTSLYDAIHRTAQEMEKLEGRKAMVVLSDGADTTSRRSYHEALEAALRAEAAIYSIAVIPIRSQSGRSTAGEHSLVGLARSTGGASFAQDSLISLETAFTQIEEELRTQYLLGYYPEQNPPQPQNRSGATSLPRYVRIEVRMKNPSWIARAREGYYAAKSSDK